MKLKKIIMVGFMRFKERTEVEFPQGQITLIAGDNGAGKTSILESLCLCLYGKTLRTIGKTTSGYLKESDLINHDCDKAMIEVQFENYGHNYVVRRKISKSSSQSEILEDGLSKAVGSRVFNYIQNRAIGLDWEGFRKSTVVL